MAEFSSFADLVARADDDDVQITGSSHHTLTQGAGVICKMKPIQADIRTSPSPLIKKRDRAHTEPRNKETIQMTEDLLNNPSRRPNIPKTTAIAALQRSPWKLGLARVDYDTYLEDPF